MSQEKSNIRTQLEKAGAPDYMILVMENINGVRDELREAMAAHNKQKAQDQTNLAHERTILAEERAAFVKATQDMRQMVNQAYGPESEVGKINLRLNEIVEDNQKRNQAVLDLEERIANLERGSSGRIAL